MEGTCNQTRPTQLLQTLVSPQAVWLMAGATPTYSSKPVSVISIECLQQRQVSVSALRCLWIVEDQCKAAHVQHGQQALQAVTCCWVW